MQSTPKNIFYKDVVVTTEHLDHLQHVNNVVYVKWLQEMAYDHWTSFVSPEMHEKVFWVVRRHEIDYLAQAFLGDELLLKTFTGVHSGVTWDRHYEIIRKSDNKKIIVAKSVWALLDRITFKPRRIDDEVLRVLS